MYSKMNVIAVKPVFMFEKGATSETTINYTKYCII